ncbi:MAG: ATP-binding protein [Methylococcales bacterium]
MKPDLDKINFSNQRSAIPFGKFETRQDDVFPCNESMIGREGARAKLIDFLTNGGTRKAILVTGKRGIGKTSFVEYCLKEYEEARIERYWQSNFGRSAFSLIWLLVISFAIVGSFILGGRLLEILIDNLGELQYILLLPIGLLVCLLSYPLLLSGIIFKKIFNYPNNNVYFLVLIIFITLWNIDLFIDKQSNLFSLGLLLTTLATVYATGEISNCISRKKRLVSSISALFFGATTSLVFIILNTHLIFSNYLIFSILIFLIGLISKRYSLKYIKNKSLLNTIIIPTFDKSIKKYNGVICLGIFTIMFIMYIFLVPNKENQTIDLLYPYILSIITPLLLILILILIKKYKAPQKSTRNSYPSAVLGIKAVFFILLSLIAIEPLIDFFLGRIQSHLPYNLILNYLHIHIESKPHYNLLFKIEDEWKFLIASIITLSLIFFAEYEWIIRPIQYARRDSSLHTGIGAAIYYNNFDLIKREFSSEIPNGYSDRKYAREVSHKYYMDSAEERQKHRVLEKLTFHYYFNYFHLTSLVSTINLGFDELDHRSVIHATLLGIREKYYARFISLRNVSVLIRYIFGFLIAMLLVSFMTKIFFNSKDITPKTTKESSQETTNINSSINLSTILQSLELSGINKFHNELRTSHLTDKSRQYKQSINKYCRSDNNLLLKNLPSVPKLFCELGGYFSEKLLPILYFRLISIHLDKRYMHDQLDIFSWPFDIRKPYYEKTNELQIGLTIYHFLLFISILFIFRRFNRAFWLIPYSLNLERIDDLLDSLTSTVNKKQHRDLPTLARWMSSFSGSYQESEKNTIQPNLDPRAVELGFMNILQDISHSSPIYFKPMQSGECSPFIEFTFVFDELDKLATDVNYRQQKTDPDTNDSELHRLNLMKGLLSNMKRIITSSEARFIFLGGRLLHDDWLADGARRQPLLTSIFSDEIYLPSLLTDSNIDWFGSAKESGTTKAVGNSPIHQRIEEYFILQFYLARVRFDHWGTRIWSPVTGFPEQGMLSRGYTQVSYAKLKHQLNCIHKTPLQTIPLHYTDKVEKEPGSIDFDSAENRVEAFVHFLAYRSRGNPKRLNELLASFMVSVDRAVPNPDTRNKHFICQDVLYLPDHKVMHIQLISRIYQQLRRGYEEKFRGRGDKTISALIYMSDFLFKFHNRAISWENLELVDELIHMHRGHDLRSLLHELVDHYSDRYLHRIINGMYNYRFRSYFANEIKYLSQHSEAEMAAFNFTLDEGQMLRDHLENLLEKGGGRDKTDILNMLGEMHEFYQEYERARYYYRQCITIRHQMYKEYIGETVGKSDNEVSILQAIYSNLPEGRKALLALQNWAPNTLRLSLKIIITYEKEHNDTEALNRCKLCIKYAEAMVQAFVSTEDEQINGFIPQNESTSDRVANHSDHAYVLEHLGLLFEPLFAYAWLLEKDSFTSSNSFLVLKEGIDKFDDLFSKNNQLDFINALLHKKIGALCFYKGLAKTNKHETSDAPYYVEKAHCYYAESARKLSSYFRQMQMEYKKNDPKSFPEALLQNQYPADYCLSVAECLGDLSESILATINPVELKENGGCASLNIIHEIGSPRIIELIKQLDQWFFDSTNHTENCVLDILSKFYSNNHTFEELAIENKFDLALNLSLASSFYLVRAGYVESAAREAMHSAEILAQYLHWYWFDFVTKGQIEHYWQGSSLLFIAMEKIDWFATYLPWLLREVRIIDSKQNSEKHTPYLMGSFIPSSALTTLCSIGLSLTFFNKECNSKNRIEIQPFLENLSKIVLKWSGGDIPYYVNSKDIKHVDLVTRDKYHENPLYSMSTYSWYSFFENKLIYSLQRHRYPVLNQLNALKTLVDASLIKGFLTEKPDTTKNTSAWLQELFHINKKYGHPLHFTPMQCGHSFYLYCYVKKHKEYLLPERDTKLDFDINTETRQLLVQSLDMCHMGRGYYKAIDKLYYLYDDFNDNQIHRNHSMQMAGAELTKKSLANFQNISCQPIGIINMELLQ